MREQLLEQMEAVHRSTWEGLSLDPARCHDAFAELKEAYTDPARTYRNLFYIVRGLYSLRIVPDLVEALDRREQLLVKMAWMYHAIHINPTATTARNRIEAAMCAVAVIAPADQSDVASRVSGLLQISPYADSVPLLQTPSGHLMWDLQIVPWMGDHILLLQDEENLSKEILRGFQDSTVYWLQRAEVLRALLQHERLLRSKVAARFEVSIRQNLIRMVEWLDGRVTTPA